MQRPVGGGTTLDQDIVDALEANTRLDATNYVPGISDVPTWFVMGASQAAVTYNTLATILNKSYFKYNPIVTYEAGEYSGIDLSEVCTACTLLGDTRPLAGHTWVHCADSTTVVPHWSTATGAGVGAVTLANGTGDGANDVIITCATTNPDLSSIVAGDKLLIKEAAGSALIYTVDSLVSATRVTLTTEAPTLGAYGDAITLIPNRSITDAMTIANSERVTFQGFYINNYMTVSGKVGFTNNLIRKFGGDYVLNVTSTGDVLFNSYENTLSGSSAHNIRCYGGKVTGPVTSINGQLYFNGATGINLQYSRNIGGATGFYADCGSSIDARHCFGAKNGDYAFKTQRSSSMDASASSAYVGGIGYYAMSKSTMVVNTYEEYGCTFVYDTSDGTIDISA